MGILGWMILVVIVGIVAGFVWLIYMSRPPRQQVGGQPYPPAPGANPPAPARNVPAPAPAGQTRTWQEVTEDFGAKIWRNVGIPLLCAAGMFVSFYFLLPIVARSAYRPFGLYLSNAPWYFWYCLIVFGLTGFFLGLSRSPDWRRTMRRISVIIPVVGTATLVISFAMFWLNISLPEPVIAAGYSSVSDTGTSAVTPLKPVFTSEAYKEAQAKLEEARRLKAEHDLEVAEQKAIARMEAEAAKLIAATQPAKPEPVAPAAVQQVAFQQPVKGYRELIDKHFTAHKFGSGAPREIRSANPNSEQRAELAKLGIPLDRCQFGWRTVTPGDIIKVYPDNNDSRWTYWPRQDNTKHFGKADSVSFEGVTGDVEVETYWHVYIE
jgi:hypothetical protein